MVDYFNHASYTNRPVASRLSIQEGGARMPLNIKNNEVESLVSEVAELTGESKTEAVRRALEERRERLAFRVTSGNRAARLKRFLEQEVWPIVPEGELGRRLSRAEEEAILGYGPEGV
jgi:antitoxin VapB